MKKLNKAVVLFLCVCLCTASFAGLTASASRQKVIPGGMTFGVKFFTDGLLVVGTADVSTETGLVSPAKDSGIKTKDVILSLDGQKVTTSEDFAEKVDSSKGKALALTVKSADGTERNISITPVLCSKTGRWCIGVWVKDSTAGIGTVTYINAFTGDFGGLGHGICDIDTGTVLPVGKAYVVDVDVTSVVKSQPRAPGELKGAFGKSVVGEIYQNAKTGVKGKLDTLPQKLREPMETAKRKEVKEGAATVLCQVNDRVAEYEIEISKIYKDSKDTKNFLIKVTDPKLIEITGGIVQGMSGSPIIQDGKLIGAVTHVLINDPTKGYGIFIENMLESAG